MKVYFFLAVFLTGQPPQTHEEQVVDIQTCIAMVAGVLNGRQPTVPYQVSCGVVPEPETKT
jgi:hypothetical protein